MKFAIRTLLRRPLYTATAVGALAIGLGSATAMYTVVDGVLVQRPPYRFADRLVNVWTTSPEWREIPGLSHMWDQGLATYPTFQEFRRRTTTLEAISAYGDGQMLLTTGEATRKVRVGTATASLFQTLGVTPLLGRDFRPGEDGFTARRVTILSHALWTIQYGSDPGVIGATVRLDNLPYTIIGVLPEEFRFPSVVLAGLLGTEHLGDHALWVSVGHRGVDLNDDDSNYELVARLLPGSSLGQAETEATAIFGRPSRIAFRVAEETGGFAGTLSLLLGMSAVLLLISCFNAAGIFSAEVLRRGREVAVRLALGASVGRIIRQLLMEAVLIGAMASVLALGMALVIPGIVLALGPALPHPETVTVNARVVSLALATGLLSALFFTLVPTLRLRTLQPSALFRGRTSSGRMAWNRVHVGVAGQVALTTVLLVSGGLSLRTLSALNGVDVGFDPQGVVTTRVALPAWEYQDPEVINRFYTQVHGLIEASPGVESVSAGRGLPFSSLGQAFNSVQRIADDGEVIRFDTRRTNVLPHYFETLGIPVRRGRGFTWQDELGAPDVAIISESLARREWPDGDALGRSIGFRSREYAVIGVVGDVRSTDLTGEVEPVLYLPALQYMEGDMYFLARATTDPLAVLRQVRSAILEVDPSAAIIQETSLLSFMKDSIRDERFRTLLMVMFGASALLLSAVGLGGTVARLVTQRTREWGVRSALGASPRGLMAHIVLRSLTPAALGVIAGLALALAAGRFMRPFLYGVEPWDPTTLGVVAAGLAAICVVAAALPARRATHVHPSRALSEE